MRFVLSLLFLPLFGFLAGFGPAPNSNRAFEIISQSERYFVSLQDFASGFHQTIEGGLDGSGGTIEGEIRYRQGMYAILTSEQEIYCNRSSQWFVDKRNQEVTRVPYHPTEDVAQQMLFSVFRNKANSSYQGQQMVGEVMCNKVKVDIQDPALNYYKGMVWISQTDNLITKIVLIDRQQITTTYLFFDHQINPGFSQEDFTFTD
jgi:outer membrane lipoprotein-sorting protein